MAKGTCGEQVANDLIKRLLPGNESKFDLSLHATCRSNSACYTVRTTHDRVQIYGTSGKVSPFVWVGD